MTASPGVEAYLAALPDDRRAVLERLRATIRAAAPEAVETIAYDMPAYRLNGRFLVSFAAYRAHYSLFPASEVVRNALGEELAPYLAGKGTVRLPADRPLPDDLIRRIVELRCQELVAGAPR